MPRGTRGVTKDSVSCSFTKTLKKRIDDFVDNSEEFNSRSDFLEYAARFYLDLRENKIELREKKNG